MKYRLILGFIVTLTILSRFYGLTFQSLWLDEIYTVTTSHPGNTLHDIFQELKNDFHPPLHYLLTYFVFNYFPYGDFTARALSAIIGVIGVLAFYLLGREVKDAKTGILMSSLLAINAFHLYYSQEVRMYGLLLLLTATTLLYFFKIIKHHRNKDFWLFGISAVLLLYTHYFGFLVLAGLSFTALHFIISKNIPMKVFMKFFGTVTMVLFAYIPWVPYLIKSGSSSHWMKLPSVSFIFEYLYQLTGKEPLSTLAIIIALIMLIVSSKKSVSMNYRYLYKWTIIYGLLSIFVLAYLISVFKPILQLRCAIVALPFLFGAVIIAFDSLKQMYQNVLYSIMVVVAVINILFVMNYYTKPTKENYRDVAKTVYNSKPKGPIISHYHRYYNYYLKQFGNAYEAMDVNGMVPDSVLHDAAELLILNAHNHENIMTMPQYSDWQNYININYTNVKEYKQSATETETAVLFKRVYLHN